MFRSTIRVLNDLNDSDTNESVKNKIRGGYMDNRSEPSEGSGKQLIPVNDNEPSVNDT